MSLACLLRWLLDINSIVLEATSQDLFQEQTLGHICLSEEDDGDNRLR